MRLGKTQQMVLECLRDHKGWSTRSTWVWDTPMNTKRILDSMIKYGVVEISDYEQYTITEAGITELDRG